MSERSERTTATVAPARSAGSLIRTAREAVSR